MVVLHWPKLFEGKVWTLTGSGYGHGNGYGYGAGYGDDWGNSSFTSSLGDGFYRRRGDGFAGDGVGYGYGNGEGASR